MTTFVSFKRTVWAYYRAHGRHTLPWRLTLDPYHILVSEVMLQQTQVDRVIPKYQNFIKKFPSAAVLAQASLQEVLQLWVGLGYNRRAKYLHEAATVIAHEGFPRLPVDLQRLPGVGTYTAGAVAAFAYNIPMVIIETNIRSVFIHHFFADRDQVTDAEILPLILATLDHKNPREWYYALMDYGVYLKRQHGSNNAKSAQYVKQKPFMGSSRALRGALVRTITQSTKPVSCTELSRILGEDTARVETELGRLVAEGLLCVQRGRYRVAT